MDILGIGPLELLFILIIALIVLGPSDMVKAGRTLGRTLRKVVTHPTWQVVQQTSRDLRHLPNRLMREAGLEDLQEILPTKELEQIGQDLKQTTDDIAEWTTPPDISLSSLSPGSSPDEPDTSPAEPASIPTQPDSSLTEPDTSSESDYEDEAPQSNKLAKDVEDAQATASQTLDDDQEES